MRATGLEPARQGHQNLNLARLPFRHARESVNSISWTDIFSNAGVITDVNELVNVQVGYLKAYFISLSILLLVFMFYSLPKKSGML